MYSVAASKGKKAFPPLSALTMLCHCSSRLFEEMTLAHNANFGWVGGRGPYGLFSKINMYTTFMEVSQQFSHYMWSQVSV